MSVSSFIDFLLGPDIPGVNTHAQYKVHVASGQDRAQYAVHDAPDYGPNGEHYPGSAPYTTPYINCQRGDPGETVEWGGRPGDLAYKMDFARRAKRGQNW